jgi:diguanylate cyclase (GGDEF)-like protein
MVANSLKRILRDTDIVARFGGEEFVIVLPHTNLKLSQHMAERVRAEMAAMQVELDGASSFSITVSIGVAAFPQHGSTVESLINTADKRLYIAKEGGRNRVSVV